MPLRLSPQLRSIDRAVQHKWFYLFLFGCETSIKMIIKHLNTVCVVCVATGDVLSSSVSSSRLTTIRLSFNIREKERERGRAWSIYLRRRCVNTQLRCSERRMAATHSFRNKTENEIQIDLDHESPSKFHTCISQVGKYSNFIVVRSNTESRNGAYVCLIFQLVINFLRHFPLRRLRSAAIIISTLSDEK